MPEETSLHLPFEAQDQQLGAEQDQFFVSPQECLLATAKTRKLAWFGHVTRHDSLSRTFIRGSSILHPSSTLEGGQRRGRSAEDMLDGQHQRVDIPAHARTAHNGLLRKGFEEDLCRIVFNVLLTIQSVMGLN